MDGCGPGARYVVRVEEEGTKGIVWAKDVGSATSVAYNSDGTATRATLQPNRAYHWQVEAWLDIDNRVSDARVAICEMQQTGARFWVYGPWEATPPALPGKLLYSCGSSVTPGEVFDALWAGTNWLMQYDNDPAVRRWIGFDGGWFGDWSPDGTKLLYAADKPLVDSLDGSAPVPLNLPEGAGEVRWASDSQRVTFSRYDAGANQYKGVWVSNIDGTNCHSIVPDTEVNCRYPQWSPDGLWVTYRKLPDTVGVGLWMVRYDGQEEHPLVPTGVEGYPGSSVTFLGEANWSPDGNTLALEFKGLDGDGGNMAGLGTMSRDGGLVKPVFMSPPGLCCAGPRSPHWSPDGTQIVFSSGHHLADPAPPNVFEPRVELWLIAADGSGDPVRLTYNNTYDTPDSWWAPNTQAGTDVTVVKGDNAVTFDQVDATGNTTVTVYEGQPEVLPTNFLLAGDYYQIGTTADFSGLVTVSMKYRPEDVPSGSALALFHFDDATQQWIDITTARRPGQSHHLWSDGLFLRIRSRTRGALAVLPRRAQQRLRPHWLVPLLGLLADQGLRGCRPCTRRLRRRLSSRGRCHPRPDGRLRLPRSRRR